MNWKNQSAGELADDSNKHILLQEGSKHYEAQRYSEALATFEKIIQLDPNYAAAYVHKGDCLRQLGNYGQAILTYQQAIDIAPHNSSAYVGISYTCLKLSEYPRASFASQEAIRLDPKNVSAYNAAGQVLCAQGRFKEALQAFEDATRLASKDHNIAGFHNNRGVVLLELLRYQEALDAFVLALQLEPDNDKYLKNLFRIHKYERFKKANQFCDQADTMSFEHRYVDALLFFNKALQINPDHIRAVIWKGYLQINNYRYEEALAIFNQHLQIFPRSVQALLGKGKVLYKLKCYDEALSVFQQVLQFDSQLAQAIVNAGHSYLALNRSMDALKCYRDAITLQSDDVTCYINASAILLELQCNEAVIQVYIWALQFIPNLASIYRKLSYPLLKLAMCWPYLVACRKILKQGTTDITIYISIRDTLAELGHREDATEAHEKAVHLALVKDNLANDQLWSLICHPLTKCNLGHIQFELLRRYISAAPMRVQRKDAFQLISDLFLKLFETDNIPGEELRSNLQILHTILLHIPEVEREEALTLISVNDDIRIVQLLILLAPFSLTGLTALAHQITLRWVVTRRNDDLVIRFYHILKWYNVPYEDGDWLFAQELVLDGLYIQAKSILSDLVTLHPMPERLWLLAKAMWHCHDPEQEQIEILHRFIDSVDTADKRCGEAWKRVGELALNLHDFQVAIEAFQTAEHFDNSSESVSSQLKQYRTGEWDTFPGSSQHPDFAFPVVVVIDLECDYQEGAADGSRVFEIGIVRRKGRSTLEECNLVIKRDFISPKVADRQHEAIQSECAAQILTDFIGTAIVVGHNLEGFDIRHLRGMGARINEDQIIDTLSFARLLYPDSVYHNLALLCVRHDISFRGEQHTALPDAHACADLLHALGDELLRRGERLLNGFRALVPQGSAIDRAVLQPRGIPAAESISWDLDPSPTLPHSLVITHQGEASPGILTALDKGIDALIERNDSSGAYIRYLSPQQRSIVAVDSQTRVERMLAQIQHTLGTYVLPDAYTLLCPCQLRQAIELSNNWQMKLTLYCLYQESHNHDARSLYPLRIPCDDPFTKELKQRLLASCCSNMPGQHSTSCPGMLAAISACKTHNVLLATHECFIHQLSQHEADVIIIDDADNLQMHFAEYLAERLTSEQIYSYSEKLFHLLNKQVELYIKEHIRHPGPHMRVPLQNIVPYLTQLQPSANKAALAQLQASGLPGESLAAALEKVWNQAIYEEPAPGEIYAYWLEIRTSQQPGDETWSIEQWSFCSLNKNLHQAFRQHFWRPYKQHLFCGTALTLGAFGTTFITRFFGLHENIKLLVDFRPASQIYIPSREDIRPASFLGKRSWARSIGDFLYRVISTKQRSVLVSLQTPNVAHALTRVFKVHPTGRQVLSRLLGWSTTKIADRLASETRYTLAFISPRLRKEMFDDSVDVEATGPLIFLNQQDPLVAAHIRLYLRVYPNENPFSSYLLPQALLELKSRLSSHAKLHLILDSGLHSKVYIDEVRSLFQKDTLLDSLPGITDKAETIPETFSNTLETELEHWGLGSQSKVENEMLHLALQTYWETDRFRETPLNQIAIVQAIFDGRDQLVIAATGGGKSLCFQLPAILMAQEIVPKVTLVISPLIALMQDQVTALQNKGIFSAIVWNSTLSDTQRKSYLEGIRRGWYSIIYAAPEQIHSSALRKALDAREIGLIAIDEAHCVSQWGHNFRTEYIALKSWINAALCDGKPRSFPMIALTATARRGYEDPSTGLIEQGTVQDIVENLGLRLTSTDAHITSPDRPELKFSVEQIAVPCTYCQYPLHSVKNEIKCPSCGRWLPIDKEQIKRAKLKRLISLLAESEGNGLRQKWHRSNGQRQRGLIYCAYTKTVDEIADALRTHPQLANLHLHIAAFHSKKTKDEKAHVYDSFIRDDEEGLDIVVATNAFGMGIDVRRLGFVIHFDIPGTLEAYIQEAGRAGRDDIYNQEGEAARCILLYHELDLEKQRFLNGKNKIGEQEIVDVYRALQKYRRRGEQEIFVTAYEISLLTGLDEGKFTSILYYLEHHTRANGIPLLERGENALSNWLFAFEHGYEQRIQNKALSLASKQLINVLLNSKDFRLRERELSLIDSDKLADYLKWDEGTLRSEINNLVGRYILVRENHLFIQYAESRDDACKFLTQLDKGMVDLLRNVPDQQALTRGKKVMVNIETIYNAKLLSVLPFRAFTRFLAALARSENVHWRLFEHFDRAITGHYEVQLVSINQAETACKYIFQQLHRVIQRLFPEKQNDTWEMLNMLAEETDYEQREQLSQQVLLLFELGLLKQDSLQQEHVAICIIFKQNNVSDDLLDIDLSRLRQVAKQGVRKLDLMKAYATAQPDQRIRLLNDYFTGASPLIEPFKMREDLTEQQREIVAISGGYRLVQGPAGSGKTTVLEEHIRYLTDYLLIPPDHILVLTHYSSGVDRISNHVNVDKSNGKTIYVKSLNKLGMSIFLQNREYLIRPDGKTYYPEKAELRLLAGEKEERPIVENALEELRSEYEVQYFPEETMKQKQYDAWFQSSASTVDKCLRGIARLRQHGIFPSSMAESEAIYEILKDFRDQNLADFVYDVYCRYLLLLGDAGKSTFDDQILFALVILKANPPIATSYQRRYEHIIVDEFQDLTHAQSELIGILSQKHRNVIAFGDDAQDIRPKEENNYRMQSTMVRCFQQLSGNKPPTKYTLKMNFRSVQEILDVASAIRKEALQKAARDYRGEKPGVILVNPNFTSQPGDYHEHSIIKAMVKESLALRKSLPEDDRGSAALMVAKSDWSRIVQDCLIEIQEPFAVMDRNSYESQHIKQVLSYFRLIINDHLDAELELLLSYCVKPSLSSRQLDDLKEIARENSEPLISMLLDSNLLAQINISSEKQQALWQHLDTIYAYGPESRFADVWQAVSKISEGPLSIDTNDKQRRDELEGVINKFRDSNVAQAIKDINSHLSFLEEHRTDRQLVVTSIDYAKSQAFDTVFLLGAQALSLNKPKSRERLYVSISRARQRFFFLVDAVSDEAKGNDALLPWLSKELSDKLVWL